MKDITTILGEIEQQGSQAAAQLLPLVYDELRRHAQRLIAQERPGQTLQPTALVHEAYLRLVDEPARTWKSRRHFFAAAAEAMRRVLIDQARRKRRPKHGGDRQRVELPDVADQKELSAEDLIDLDEALTAFADEDPAKAELVQLRYFAGLELEEIADLMGISRATASRHWLYARTWLLERVEGCRARNCEKEDAPP
jgi:RNA polymerase sigma factor (TIGR02999 family)